jgi:hypothetical protein
MSIQGAYRMETKHTCMWSFCTHNWFNKMPWIGTVGTASRLPSRPWIIFYSAFINRYKQTCQDAVNLRYVLDKRIDPGELWGYSKEGVHVMFTDHWENWVGVIKQRSVLTLPRLLDIPILTMNDFSEENKIPPLSNMHMDNHRFIHGYHCSLPTHPSFVWKFEIDSNVNVLKPHTHSSVPLCWLVTWSLKLEGQLERR